MLFWMVWILWGMSIISLTNLLNLSLCCINEQILYSPRTTFFLLYKLGEF